MLNDAVFKTIAGNGNKSEKIRSGLVSIVGNMFFVLFLFCFSVVFSFVPVVYLVCLSFISCFHIITIRVYISSVVSYVDSAPAPPTPTCSRLFHAGVCNLAYYSGSAAVICSSCCLELHVMVFTSFTVSCKAGHFRKL